MTKVPKISDAEWEVMQVIWDNHPILASDVVDRLAPQTGWSDRTIRTMLGRLSHSKEIVICTDPRFAGKLAWPRRVSRF